MTQLRPTSSMENVFSIAVDASNATIEILGKTGHFSCVKLLEDKRTNRLDSIVKNTNVGRLLR